MLVCIADFLHAAEIADLRSLFTIRTLRPGERTAGWHAKQVKQNLQIEADTPAGQRAGDILSAAFKRSPIFQSAVMPCRIRPPLLARYEGEMTYGDHVDDALMGTGDQRSRSDVSVTVFLTEPESYEGGELVMDTPSGSQAWKLPAGSAITYPSTTLHRVDPVTSGTRDVAVTWVQSLVRDPGQREILFDLDRTRRTLFDRDGKSPDFDVLSKCHANLLRQWAEL